MTDDEKRAVEASVRSGFVVADHLLELLNEGVALIERGDLHIVSEEGEDGFIAAYRWPKVGSWHRILAWKSKVRQQLVGLGEYTPASGEPAAPPPRRTPGGHDCGVTSFRRRCASSKRSAPCALPTTRQRRRGDSGSASGP